MIGKKKHLQAWQTTSLRGAEEGLIELASKQLLII
jgi:hypothetical protein